MGVEDQEPEFRVIAYSGYQVEQEPRALIVEGQRLEVVEVEDRWYDPRARHFRVRASDGRSYLVRYDLEELRWSRIECERVDAR
jgi:hypothetical protein